MRNNSDNSASDRAGDPLDQLLRSAQWPDDTSDPLDKLLRKAKWPEPTADPFHWRQQLAQWQSRKLAESTDARPHVKSVPNSRRKSWRTAWAIAGSVAVAAVLMLTAFWVMRLGGEKPSAGAADAVAQNPAPLPAVSSGTSIHRDPPPTDARETFPEAAVSGNTVAAAGSPVPLAMPHGDPYQRMLRARRQARASSEGEDAIDRIVTQRIANPDGDLQELVQPLLAERAECERRLLERFHTFADEQEAAAIEVLGSVGGEASLPLVRQLSFRPATHAPAVRALLKIADTTLLARLAFNEADPDLRKEIVAALRAREDTQTLVLVLAVQGE